MSDLLVWMLLPLAMFVLFGISYLQEVGLDLLRGRERAKQEKKSRLRRALLWTMVYTVAMIVFT